VTSFACVIASPPLRARGRNDDSRRDVTRIGLPRNDE